MRGKQEVARIVFPMRGELPKEIHVSFRLPENKTLVQVKANGKPVPIGGRHKDAAIITADGGRKLEVVAQFSQ